jgi:hypothetical protein
LVFGKAGIYPAAKFWLIHIIFINSISTEIEPMHPAIFEILPENQIPVSTIENSQELEIALEIQIAHMLVHETEKLWQVLYRLDVSEKKVRELLQKNPETVWPQGITKLILEREDERQKWREVYKSGTDSKPS